jgi:hypothetical protein
VVVARAPAAAGARLDGLAPAPDAHLVPDARREDDGPFFDALPLPHPALNAIVFLQAPTVIGFVLIVRAGRREGQVAP